MKKKARICTVTVVTKHLHRVAGINFKQSWDYNFAKGMPMETYYNKFSGGAILVNRVRKLLDYKYRAQYKRQPIAAYASVYDFTQHYGGSEEGGWYYHTQQFLRAIKIRCKSSNVDGCNHITYFNKKERRKVNRLMKSLEEMNRYGEGESVLIERKAGIRENLNHQHYE